MRLFISIEPPKEVRAALDNILPDHPQIRKTDVGQLHLTLLYLGETEAGIVDEITEELGKVRFRAFRIKPAGVGAFPSEKSPRVIWAGVKASESLNRLQKRIEAVSSRFLPDEGDNKPFHPHITLARVKDGGRYPKLVREATAPDLPEFAVEKFLLKQSKLHQNGAIHQTVKEFPAT
ncbi:MAG: RNA 2',3'-cyclic phosphodiesterase [Balneolaceae bacterium]|nr:RNA 2',3'-cyclic phosphodiesterase [Balneolaceae bacterium]MCH8548710.1 RNA 2',3'-cyclic phosphodiesterase [Balneolaceae bacterium]